MHTGDQGAAKFKDAAETSAGGFAAGPVRAALGCAACGAFDGEVVAGDEIEETINVVRNACENLRETRSKLEKGLLAFSDAEFWKEDMCILGKEFDKIRVAGIEAPKVLF